MPKHIASGLKYLAAVKLKMTGKSHQEIADELGLIENKDYFYVYDKCLTELTAEEKTGVTLTCIGFKPLPDEIAWKISKKYQLYK